MALSKLDKTSQDHKMLETFEDEWAQVLMDLIDKVNTGFDKTNEHITKVASMQTEINTEKNKTGITQEQADAIAANTSKVGITDEQIKNIKDNTAKTGITSKQASQIDTNAIATTQLLMGVENNIPTSDKRITASMEKRVVIEKTGTSLVLLITIERAVYSVTLPLTRLK